MTKPAIQIVRTDGLDGDTCRRLILSSEPWKRLHYGYPEADAIARSAIGANVLVARDGDRIVGFAVSSPALLLGEYLRILVVEEPYRSCGIGRAMMDVVERDAFRHWPNVYLCVSDFNARARAFYRRLGYVEVGALPDLLVPGVSEILMRKSIGAWKVFNRAAPRHGQPQ